MFFWIIISSNWTWNTLFAIPKRKFRCACATTVLFIPHSFESFSINWAFTNIMRINLPWRLTWGFTIALLRIRIVQLIEWAWFAFLIYWIEYSGRRTLNTIITNLCETFWATWFNFIIIIAYILWRIIKLRNRQ